MVGSEQDARNRMVRGAAEMIGRRGLNATSVRDLARYAGAPLGSTYHYFPGGKAQLAAEAVRWADAQTTGVLSRSMGDGPVAVLRAFVDTWRKELSSSEFRCGCPVLAVAVEEELPGGDSSPRDAAVFAFSNWTATLARSLRDAGSAHGAAADTATLIVAAVEGAVAMSRAERSVQPLEVVGRQLEQVLAGLT
ncbi:MAG: TetR/AcrR family transcriptional regulator [Mycobacterium sp.]